MNRGPSLGSGQKGCWFDVGIVNRDIGSSSESRDTDCIKVNGSTVSRSRIESY